MTAEKDKVAKFKGQKGDDVRVYLGRSYPNYELQCGSLGADKSSSLLGEIYGHNN